MFKYSWKGIAASMAAMGLLALAPTQAEAAESSTASASVATYDAGSAKKVKSKYSFTVQDGLYSGSSGSFTWTDSPTIVQSASVKDTASGWSFKVKSAVPMSEREEIEKRDVFYGFVQKSYKTKAGLKGKVGLKETYYPHKDGGTHKQVIYGSTSYKVSDGFSIYGAGSVSPFDQIGANLRMGPKFNQKLPMGAKLAIQGQIGGTWEQEEPEVVNFSIFGGSAQISQKANDKVSASVGGLVNYNASKDLVDTLVNMGLSYVF